MELEPSVQSFSELGNFVNASKKLIKATIMDIISWNFATF